MLQLDPKIRDEIVKIIAGSQLPTNQGLGIINALQALKPLEVKPKEIPKK
jgi:hypothetical protein